jgi:hypothetical protein
LHNSNWNPVRRGVKVGVGWGGIGEDVDEQEADREGKEAVVVDQSGNTFGFLQGPFAILLLTNAPNDQSCELEEDTE